MKPAWSWAGLVAVLALGLLAFILSRSGDRVDPGTTVPRGTHAPTQPDPEAAALAEALKKAKW